MRFLLMLLSTLATLSAALPAVADSNNIYVKPFAGNMDSVYPRVSAALEAHGFFVVFEPNIGENIKGMAEKWGVDYNRNKLSGIRSMVFCNGGYVNQLSNSDPNLLALCPLHLTLIEKDGNTRVLFTRPSSIAKGSKAEPIARNLEQDIIKAIKSATIPK